MRPPVLVKARAAEFWLSASWRSINQSINQSIVGRLSKGTEAGKDRRGRSHAGPRRRHLRLAVAVEGGARPASGNAGRRSAGEEISRLRASSFCLRRSFFCCFSCFPFWCWDDGAGACSWASEPPCVRGRVRCFAAGDVHAQRFGQRAVGSPPIGRRLQSARGNDRLRRRTEGNWKETGSKQQKKGSNEEGKTGSKQEVDKRSPAPPPPKKRKSSSTEGVGHAPACRQLTADAASAHDDGLTPHPPTPSPHGMALTNRSLARPSLLLLASCFLCAASSFPRDLQAISVLDESGDFPAFQSLLQDNRTRRLGLHFQGMTRVKRMLFITARDHVFAVNLTTAAEAFVPQMTLTWRAADVSKCAVRGKDGDECYNYIKVLVPRDDETLFVCGTNAFNPACRNYKTSTLEQVGSDLPGQARCPFESGQSNAGTFADGDFYSATVTDFLASDAVIYRSLGDGRPVLRTVKYDSKWLREPRFLHAVEYGSFVYFFLSEIAAEYTALGKVVFSRVARVCKNDNGGSPRVLDKHWTSFLKARLNCSLPGESLFYFDVLQSLTGVLQINGRPAVLAVFTTQANSIPGSAVCAFYMDDVEEVFSGKFKEQRGGDSSWTTAPEDAVPRPRPGSCAGDGPAADFKSSVDFPDETLAFVKSFPLMDGAVPAVNLRPFYTRTASGSKLTRIAADVSAGPRKERAVVFLGSEDGRVSKVLVATLPDDTSGSRLLEDIDVYDPDKCDLGVREEDRRVLGLELDKEHHALFVAFGSCLVRVPLSRCGRHGACKRACLASRDPYCIWLRTGRCADAAPGFKAGFEQDIEGDHSNMAACAADVSATSRDREIAADSAYGVRGAAAGEEDSASHVHYTLLIACVLLAFSLGAASSGLLVSRFRGGRRRDARRNGTFDKDPEASLPGASSPRPLAKLGGLPDPEEDKTGEPQRAKPYASPGPDGRAPDPVSARHRLPAAEPRVSLTRADGELGALPTPNSDSEFPWQMKSWDDPAHFAAVTGANRPAPPPFPPPRLCGDGQPSADAADVSALDDLLRHIQQVSARGDGGIRVLTSTSSGHLHPHPPHPPPRGKTRALSFNRSHQHGNRQPVSETEALALKANGAISPQRVIPEAPVRPRGPALVKIGGGLPRHHSFNRGAAASRQRLLARMNANDGGGGPPAPPAARGGRRRAAATTCLTRQHSYSEGVHLRRANVQLPNASAVRRAVSLKPKLPPKPLFLPDLPALLASEPSGR